MSDEQRRFPAFMFTDIEGSTQLWERDSEAMSKVLPRHDAILQQHISRWGGRIIKHLGDGIYAVFEQGEPLECALEIQKQFQQERWETIGELRIRIAVHAGHADKRGGDYFGRVINRTARILSTGWGGQILLTPDVTREFTMPADATLQDLGAHLLKDLSDPQQIYGLVHPALVLQEFPPLRSLSARPNNLPPQSTLFVGRDEELGELSKLLGSRECRLITVVGPGGVGKTRLALQAAAEKIDAFGQGIYFMPLDPVDSASSLVFAIADALKFSFYSREAPETQLLNYLREKEMLLVLDNFEHLLEKTDLLVTILQHVPKAKLLVTSRERLNLQEEWIIDLQGLRLPEKGQLDGLENSSAVQLFLQMAQRVQGNFSLREEEKAHVNRICQLVEGMPLGIELAAAWVRLLPVRDIAREIEQNLDFLVTKMRNVQERHRSLRAVFEHSWRLLNEEERDVFRRLSVFRGSFTRQAAQQVAGATLPLLSTLLDKSLLRLSPSGIYVMQELLRQYAEERLKEDPQTHEEAQERHCAYYARFLQQREIALKGAEQKASLEEIQRELENVRSSWLWAVEHSKIEILEESLDSLHLFYDRRSRFQEGVEILDKAIASVRSKSHAIPVTDRLLGKLLCRQGMFCHRLGQYERAQRLLEESFHVALQGQDEGEKAFCLNNLGLVAEALGKYSEAKQLYQDSLSIRRAIGDRWAIALSLNNLGNLEYRLGNYLNAQGLYRESLAIKQETGDRKGTATSLNNLGNIAAALGEYSESKQLYQESIAIKREIGDQWGMGLSLNSLGQVEEELQNYTEAKKLYQESLSISREVGDRRGIALALSNLGNVASALGELVEAKQLYQESLAIRREIRDRLGTVYCLNDWSEVAGDLGENQEARHHLLESLKTAVEIQSVPAILASLGVMAKLFSTDQKTRAVEIVTLILHHSASHKSVKDKAEYVLKKLKSELPAQAIAEAQRRGQQRRPEEIAEELLRDLPT